MQFSTKKSVGSFGRMACFFRAPKAFGASCAVASAKADARPPSVVAAGVERGSAVTYSTFRFLKLTLGTIPLSEYDVQSQVFGWTSLRGNSKKSFRQAEPP